VSPDDVKAAAVPVLGHRVAGNGADLGAGRALVAQAVDEIQVPVPV
jgi:hypothetical protein